MNSSDRRNGKSPPLEIQELPISRLVPGECFLTKDAVEGYKASITDGNEIEPPRVTPIEDKYYVQDGNHRIMAMKLLGFESVRCRIRPYHPAKNGADYETDQFHRAVRNNHVGFAGIKMGSSDEKDKNYEEEEEEEFQQGFLDSYFANAASDPEECQDDEGFFADDCESNGR